ncbi:MAG: prepilin peptidase [Caulobacteraceae bacterium]
MIWDLIIVYLYVFFTGCCFGSLYNVCIYRLPRKESIVRPRSHCTSCGRYLGILDIIPLVSYISLKGRCRYCGAKIPARYLLAEIQTGLMFLIVFSKYLVTLRTLVVIAILSILYIIGMIERDSLKSKEKRRPSYILILYALSVLYILL